MSPPLALVVAHLAEPAALVRIIDMLLVQGGRPERIEFRPAAMGYDLRIEASGLASDRAASLSCRLASLIGVAGVGCGTLRGPLPGQAFTSA